MTPDEATSRKLAARAKALKMAAKELREEAERLAGDGDRAEALSDTYAKFAKLPELMERIEGYISDGDSDASAIARAARSMEPFCQDEDRARSAEAWLAGHWRDWRRRSRQAAEWTRDREIMRLAWAGLSNTEIARIAQIHPGSVSRIIRRKLNSGRALSSGEHHEPIPRIVGRRALVDHSGPRRP